MNVAGNPPCSGRGDEAEAGTPECTGRPRCPGRTNAAAILAAVALAYANALNTPFVFDDFAAIVENESIRAARSWTEVFSPPPNTGVSGRPLVNATLAFNYALGGLDPRGYHLFNVVAHALAALTLWGILRRTAAAAMALPVALLWAVHPLQTESVTCIVQRNEVVVGLLYLLTLYAFLRGVGIDVAVDVRRRTQAASASSSPPSPGAGTTGRTLQQCWLVVAVIACAFGMLSKEVMATAPVLVLLCDRTLVAGSFAAAWRQRRWFYVGLFSTWLILAGLMLSAESRGGTVGFGLGVSAWEYALTQCRAIVLYLKLALWPYPLVLDYGRDVVRNWTEVAPHAALLVGLLAATLRGLGRRSAAGLLGAWFFLILSPSSSVVPLTTQTMAEHRMYLPLAAVLVFLALAARRLGGRAATGVGWAAAIAGVALTLARNADYRSELAVWTDTVAKAPANPRAHNNLGLALLQAGRAVEAESHFEHAVRLDVRYSPALANLGDRLLARGNVATAVERYRSALRISPDYAQVHFNLANALAQLGDDAAALGHYEAAATLQPRDARKQHALGVALLKARRPGDAVEPLRTALRLEPGFAEACNNLGTALLALGDTAGARRQFERALQIQPGYARARANLERLDALERR